jgi:general secretion pathway protein B
MSLILDALRKSEHQRQRQAGPALVVVPESQASRRPAAWILVLGVLLVVNIVVLTAVLLTSRQPREGATDPPAVPAAASTPGQPAAAPAARSTTEPLSLPPQPPRSDVRPLAAEVATPAPPPARATTSGARPSPGGATADAPAASVPTPAPAPAIPVAAVDPRAADDARLPRFTDLVVRGELNVPHMHVDIHVFSANPAERFVFINMRRYNEGQATQEGPRIERIVRDGVVMDYQGQRFFLARD